VFKKFGKTLPLDPVEPAAEEAQEDVVNESYEAPQAEPEVPSYPRAVASGGHRNVLSSDVEIKGNIRFRNELVIDGRIEGRIDSEGDLTVGQNAEVHGEIQTKSVVVQGKVFGNITVDERCELHGQAQLLGDLKSARLLIQDGATFVGRSEVNPTGVALPVSGESELGKITSFKSR